MSLAKLFGGGKKKDEAPSVQDAIQKLRETEEILNKKSDFLEKRIQEQLLTAKKAGTKNTRVAFAALKRKKRFEKQLQTIDNTLSSIEFQRETLENTTTTVETVKALGYGAKALKNVTKQLSVEDVNELIDDIAEEINTANELSETLSGWGTTLGDDMDEDELMAELEDLEQDDLDEQMLDIGTDLPSVPTTSLPEIPTKTKEKKKVDHDDMSELEKWASA